MKAKKMKPKTKRGRPRKMNKKKPSDNDAPENGINSSEAVFPDEKINAPQVRRKSKRKIIDVKIKTEPVDCSSAAEPSVTIGSEPNRKRRRRKVGDKRRRRVAKPKVKDLSVTLGLEKPLPRLTKAQKDKLDDDELQEHRFKEEIRKLSNIEEVLRLSKDRNFDSDEEGMNGDDCGVMNSSDDECVNINCPKPLPRQFPGGNKSIRRNNRDIQASTAEMKEMGLIIKSSIRNSLTASNKNLKLSLEDNDLMESDVEEDIECKPDAVVKEPESDENHNPIMFPMFQKALGVQSIKFDETANDPTVYAQSLCLANSDKHIFTKQLYIEHLNWISIAAVNTVDDTNVGDKGSLAWVPGFKRKFCNRFSQLEQDDTPGSGTELDLRLRVETTKVDQSLTSLLKALHDTRLAIFNLKRHVSNVSQEKRTIYREFDIIHDKLNMRSTKFDESSSWGLKPIRVALEPPYFKTEDGLMVYPMPPEGLRRVRDFSCCFFKRDKQKWTTKDLQQLKGCIKETLHAKRVSVLTDRYEVLMADCLRQYEEDMENEGRLDAPPLDAYKRRRGRPKKSELEYSCKYGIIHPVITVLPGGITIRSEVTPRILSEWRVNEEKSLKSKTYEELVQMENEKIDWISVANKLIVKSRKHRTAEDCELAWKHEVHPRVNDRRWGVEESRRLKEIYFRLGNDWCVVSQELNIPTDREQRPGRTPYQCYFRVRNRLDPPKKVLWTEELDQHVLRRLNDFPGNWRLVAASIDDPAATKRQVIERYKKTINPVLRNGAFTRVEDCLLILTIEKLKPFLAREGHFGCLLAYLPWRCETTWRDRANNLFSDWIVPWTLHEDKMLLKLAKTMHRNWQKISEEFTSFKNRKGCLTRYKILMRRLKDERFNNSLEAYHEAYAMTRYNVFQYKHLKEILELLMRVKLNPLPEEYSNFMGLSRDREPSELRLQHMLLTFDKEILEAAVTSLTRYVQTRDDYWRNWISKHGERKRTFDRRTFHPDNPQSVASALHIRGLELKPKEAFQNLNDFEEEIYKFYARFRRTKALKLSADRPYIPDAKTLAKWYVVSRLVETPVEQLDDVPLKRKWKVLKSELEDHSLGKRKRSNDEALESSADMSPIYGENSQNEESDLEEVPEVEKKPVINEKATHGARKIVVATNEEGYILIPKEPDIKKVMQKRGRLRRNTDDSDPEFLINADGKKNATGKMRNLVSGRRRSSRVSKKKSSAESVESNVVDENAHVED